VKLSIAAVRFSELSYKEFVMTTHKLFAASLICCAVAFGAASCDRAVVEHTKTTDTPNGTSVQKTTVVEHNDGSVSKETESKTISR
jgi:hypothetical protein